MGKKLSSAPVFGVSERGAIKCTQSVTWLLIYAIKILSSYLHSKVQFGGDSSNTALTEACLGMLVSWMDGAADEVHKSFIGRSRVMT